MRWFGGTVGCTGPVSPVPSEARLLWDGEFPLWLAGDWPEHEVVALQVGGRRIAVLGPCAARPEELRCLLDGTPGRIPLWAGSFTVVIAQEHRGVTVFTDLGGATPIYTACAAGGTVWSSSSRALAPLTGGRPDAAWLAASFVAPDRLTPGRSAFAGVALVEAGSRLVLRPGRAPDAVAAWSPREGTFQEAAERLRTALEDGVKARLRGAVRPSSDCSGGADSTAMCLLAERHRRPGEPLLAVTVHPAGVTTGGDMDYAREVVEGRDGLRHLLLPLGAEQAPYAALDRLAAATDEPAPSTVTYRRLSAEAELLSGLGGDCHFTGDGGDSLLWQPLHLVDLARTRRWRRLLRDAVAWARLHQSDPWPLIVGAFSRTAPPARVEAAGWATSTACELAMEVSAAEDDRRGWTRTDVQVLRQIQTVGRTAQADGQLIEGWGVPMHNPFTDGAVIDAALTAPSMERGAPDKYKPLLSAALADVYPESVAGRATKGISDADHYRGLRENRDTVLSMADGELAALGLVDPARFAGALQLAAAGVPGLLDGLRPAVAAEVWLRTISAAQEVRWVFRERGEG